MTDAVVAGFYGKMPCKGDFVTRGLPRDLTAMLDQWFQQGLVQSQTLLDEGWSDAYFVAPIWHFYLPPNVAGVQPWLGAFIPSVDSVGRKFPCLIAVPLSEPLSQLDQFSSQHALLVELEELLLDCLEFDFNFEQFCQSVAAIGRIKVAPCDPVLEDTVSMPRMVNIAEDKTREQLDLSHACLWSSEGSDSVVPQLMLSEGLPSPKCFHYFLLGTESYSEELQND